MRKIDVFGWVALACAAAACANGQSPDLLPDAGDPCPDTTCVDAHVADAHRDVTARDASVDAATDAGADAADASADAQDASLADTSIDVAADSALDASPDAAPDVVADAPPFDAGNVCGALLPGSRRYGNTTPFSANSSHGPNYLLGSPLTIPQGGTLVGFGAFGRSAGPHFEMALYTDAGGRPGQLVAQSGQVTSCVGTMELAATSQPIVAAGNYWIMGDFDAPGSVGFDNTTTGTQIDYISLTFGSPLPAPYPGTSMHYTNQQFNYYVVLQ